MNRRDAISRVALIMGGTIISAEYFLSGCKPAPAKVAELFDAQHIKFLDEVGDTILPATKTPGAKDVHIGNFMAVMVRDCYTPANQQIFVEGLARLNDGCKQKYNKQFLDCSQAQRTGFLTVLDKEQKEYVKNKKPKQPPHYFTMMKELTLLGYFTSEPGCTLALRYLPVPGKFEGTIPYKKGDKAWATA